MQELRSHLKLGPDPADAEAIQMVPRGKDEEEDGADALFDEDDHGEEQDPVFSLYGIAPDSKLAPVLEAAREQLKLLMVRALDAAPPHAAHAALVALVACRPPNLHDGS